MIDLTKSADLFDLKMNLGCSERTILKHYSETQLQEIKDWIRERDECIRRYYQEGHPKGMSEDAWVKKHNLRFEQRFPDWPRYKSN